MELKKVVGKKKVLEVIQCTFWPNIATVVPKVTSEDVQGSKTGHSIFNYEKTCLHVIPMHVCLTANPGWEWQYTGFFCSFAMLICVQYKNNRVGNLPWRGFWKKIDFSPTGKVVVMQILVSCIDSFFDSILLFYAKFPFIW